MPVTAVDTLYERVLPFYEAINVTVGAILTDNGREFCGVPERHPYELFCQLEGIEHRTTKVRSPKTNGFVERMNRTLLDECFRVKGRETWYTAIDEIQRDLDLFLDYYNTQRSHQGYRLKGRTPAQALKDALHIDTLPAFVPVAESSEEVEDADIVTV
jgi:transposase InsO family protein